MHIYDCNGQNRRATSVEQYGMKDERVAARIPQRDKQSIEQLVGEGKFINKSDFLRKAVRELLEVKT